MGFLCVWVYLAGGVAATAGGRRPPLRLHLGHSRRRRPAAAAAARQFCQSVKRRVSESVGCVRGCGPQTRKASTGQGYCEISR